MVKRKSHKKAKIKVAREAVPLKHHRAKVRYEPVEVELSPLEIEHSPYEPPAPYVTETEKSGFWKRVGRWLGGAGSTTT